MDKTVEEKASMGAERQQLGKTVLRIVWGYLFLHVNFNLGTLDVLPDWMCYVWIILALPVLCKEEPSVSLLRPMAIVLGAVTLLKWGLAIFGASLDIYLLNLIVELVSIYFHFQFFTNLAAIAKKYDCPQEKRLLRLRTVRTVTSTLWALPIAWDRYQLLSVLIIVVQLIVVMWICVTLFSLRKSLLQVSDV